MIHDHRAEGNEREPPTDFRAVTRGISEKIRKWAMKNAWYQIGISTNHLRLRQAFGEMIEIIARDLKFHQQYLHRHQLYNCWDQLMGLCRQIDMACRAGCQNEEELLELEFLRGKAIGAAAELAELLELLPDQRQHRQKTFSAQKRQPPPEADRWITVTEAAEMLEVSKSTISKWTKEGRITHNAMGGHRRRLSRLSILLLKQEREDEYLVRDVKDLKEDVKKMTNKG